MVPPVEPLVTPLVVVEPLVVPAVPELLLLLSRLPPQAVSPRQTAPVARIQIPCFIHPSTSKEGVMHKSGQANGMCRSASEAWCDDG